MDALAAKAGIDPLEFRLKHLSDARMRRALEAVAAKFAWKAGKAPSGRGVGIACGIYSNAYTAAMAEVAVDRKTGRVQVKRVVSAVDVGLVVNPDGLRQQVEGCIAMGLGYTLTEEVHFKDGEVLDRNFDSYQIPRFSWMPKVEIILIDNPGTPRVGSRRAAHHHDGRCNRQRNLRCRRYQIAPPADDPCARTGGAPCWPVTRVLSRDYRNRLILLETSKTP